MLRLFGRYLAGPRNASRYGDGREAEELAPERRQPVVLDVMKRNVDGWTVLQQLKVDRRRITSPSWSARS